MGERKYTVKEIDRLRAIVEHKYLYGRYGYNSVPGDWNAVGMGMSRVYSEVEKVAAVEAMVRTHMQAGHTADDLLASEQTAHEV